MKNLMDNITDLNNRRLELLKAADKPKVGWISIYTPEEIFCAAGIIPFRVTGELGINNTGAGALLSNNYCSYVLSCLSEGIDGVYEFADGIVFLDACDMRKRLYEVWVQNLKPKYSFFMELPKDINKLGRDYYRLQVRSLIQSIEEHFKCKITEDSLKKAIKTFNESRKLLQDLYEVRKFNSSGISGNKMIEIIKACSSGFREEFNNSLRHLLSALKEQETEENKKSFRVMICGSYFDNGNIVDVIEKVGASVVCEDISNGIKYFEGLVSEDTDPVNAIADYYFEKGTCARIIDTDRRINHMLNLVKEYKVDSIIYFSLKFCDTNFMDFPYIQNKLSQNGIPVLLIEGERHMTNIENLKTRIQTFLETRMY